MCARQLPFFPTFPPFVKVGSAKGGARRPRGPPMRSAGVRWCVVVLPMLGARHTKLPPKEVRVRAAPLHLFQILEGGIREAERGARAGPVRSVGGRGCGGRRSPPFARDSARPRAPERLVCEGVGCGAGCGTRCGPPPPPPPAAARGDAPLARGRAGGGSISGGRSAQAVPAPLVRARAAGRQRSTSRRALRRPNPTHC